MTLRARDLAAVAGLAAIWGCGAPAQAPVHVPPTPTAAAPAAAPTPTATVSPLPVETSPAPSIYDRTPGVIHEEPGKRPREIRTPTPPPPARRP